MEAGWYPETLLHFYQDARRYVAEDSHVLRHRRRNRNFRMSVVFTCRSTDDILWSRFMGRCVLLSEAVYFQASFRFRHWLELHVNKDLNSSKSTSHFTDLRVQPAVISTKFRIIQISYINPVFRHQHASWACLFERERCQVFTKNGKFGWFYLNSLLGFTFDITSDQHFL